MEAILEIATSCRNLNDVANYFLRNITKVLPEVAERKDQFGKVIAIPESLKQINNVSQFLNNNQYLNRVLDICGERGSETKKTVSEVTKYISALTEAYSKGDALIFCKVLSLQFGVEENAFNAAESIIRCLQNAPKIMSAADKAKAKDSSSAKS